MATAPQPQIGQGSELSYRPQGATGSGTMLGTVTKISVPAFENEEVEVPSLSLKIQDAVPGVPKISAGFSVWLPAKDANLANDFIVMAFTVPCPTFTWRVTNPDESYYEFDGFVKSHKPSERELNNLISIDFEIRVRTFPTFTTAPTQS